AGDDPRVRAELEDRTKDVDAMVRALAIDGLSGSEGADGSVLTRALGDEAAIVRLAAVEAIAEGSRGFRLEERLGPLQADPDPVVAAAVGVALLGGPSRPGAVESVRRLLSHERDDVRVAAAKKLRAESPACARELAPRLV